ncbi:MAG: RagB/SusD family nutrient uptake outer membrane protein [Alistipes sp.]|nr:RagB/SusD family nutrient uptake outer membrane protein [Alistipes sp.]
MMKKIMNIRTVAFGLVAATMGLASCSDAFLEEKKDLNLVTPAIYDNYAGAEGRVNDLYAWSLDGAMSLDNTVKGMNYGADDDLSKSTEEYANGMTNYINPQVNMNTVTFTGSDLGYDYFHNQSANIQVSIWGRIRNINDVIEGIEKGSLNREEKDALQGQAYFWRAWAYYQLFKWYGGVPIVDYVQEAVPGVEGKPRSSAKEVFEFICADLDKAAKMLEAATAFGGWYSSEDWGRVTTASALALKGRVMNLWASPLFNRANDAARWEAAYKFISESISKINACGHQLVMAQDENAKSWGGMFATTLRNPEAVMVQLYNTIDGSTEAGEAKVLNNKWEQSIRPTNTHGGGGKEPSKTMIDLFPMADGKVPAAASNYQVVNAGVDSQYAYDSNCPWMNRDPRFYRTFAFPGVKWTFNGNPSATNEEYWQNGDTYELWSYVWYLKDDASKRTSDINSSNHGPDGLNKNAKGFYIRKRSCDESATESNYVYGPGFSRSAAPFMEIRYAEVVLNYAEAAAGACHLDIAAEQLRALRQRVGYTGDCGIADFADKNTAMAAVLYERMIELAYEGKRFDDIRRWMLYDGGATVATVEGAPATWAPSGWAGNTCDWLGIQQLNGQTRQKYEFYVNFDGGAGMGIGLDNNTKAADPLTMAEPVYDDEGNLTNADKIADPRPAGININNATAEQWAALKAWYDKYLVCKAYRSEYNSTLGIDDYIDFKPHYYFLGLRPGAQNNNTTLPQTIGWQNNQLAGANGTFDPLAE